MSKLMQLIQPFVFFSAIMVFLLMAGCARNVSIKNIPEPNDVKDVNQGDLEYGSTEYSMQVPESKRQELEKKYPPGFWRQKSLKIDPQDRINIAIRKFNTIPEQPDQAKDLGNTVSEVFTTAFVQSQAFNIIEREQLDKVLNELNVNQSGVIDVTNAKKIGNITGVELIVTGSVSQVGKDGRIDARVIDISTGQVILAETMSPVFDVKNINLRSVSTSNIEGLAHKIINQMIERYYRKD